MYQAPPSRRRWFQFSLGTMFVVVTIVAAWLAWQRGLVRERERLIRPPVQWLIATVPTNTTRVPWLWRQFGAHPIEVIALDKVKFSEDDARHFERLFPEAEVHRIDPHEDFVGDFLQRHPGPKNRRSRPKKPPALRRCSK